MKNRFSLAFLALLLVALTIPAFVASAQQGKQAGQGRGGSTSSSERASSAPSGRRNAAPRGRSSSQPTTAAVEQDYAEALTLVQENYIDGNKLDYNTVFKSSIIGMLRSLDPHSNYYDRDEFDELKTDQRSEYFGIGASIQNQTTAEKTDTYIIATFAGSPAARAGLRYGDKIVEVNGEKMAGKTTAEVRDKIRGPRGSVVKVLIERAAGGTDVVEITRNAVPQPSVPDAYMLRPGVGYVDMTRGFNYTTTEELTAALEDLHKQGMTSLVLDLRGNPGGFLDQAIR
ncbi:MAG TPA: PDZ domain-containing protein, partial [Pyrinomonadaceae bacterium]